jgi:hypothetical protein
MTVRVIPKLSTSRWGYGALMISYNTARLRDLTDAYYYGVSCPVCLRAHRLSLERLRQRLGDSYLLIDVLKRLKCGTCGNKRVTVRFWRPIKR